MLPLTGTCIAPLKILAKHEPPIKHLLLRRPRKRPLPLRKRRVAVGRQDGCRRRSNCRLAGNCF